MTRKMPSSCVAKDEQITEDEFYSFLLQTSLFEEGESEINDLITSHYFPQSENAQSTLERLSDYLFDLES